MDKQSLLQLLADNQLENLFSALKDQQGYYRDLVLLESQWNELRENQRNGVVSGDQANLELARIRKNLLDLIEQTSRQPNSAFETAQAPNAPNRVWWYVAAAGGGLLLFYFLYTMTTAPAAGGNTGSGDTGANTTDMETPVKPAPPKTLDLSGAQPLTLSPGDGQYERVYSIVKTSVESTGGGKSLITLTVGLNFKGSINASLSTQNFRLVSDALPGPLAPANFFAEVVDSRSYKEEDVKFELSDQITRFSIILEAKDDKVWHFSR